MASIDELKAQIDLDDLAAKLGLVKPKGMPNYSAPHRKDSKPSLSVYNNGKSWKDHGGDAGGSCVDLVMYVEQCEAGEAVKRLHELYDIPRDNQPKVRQEKSLAEFVADKCFHNTEPVKDYLKTRGLSAEIIDKAIKKKAVGFNDYIGRDKQSKQPIEKGKYGHCGPGAAFITRSMNPGRVMAVDTRYFDAEANGGVKTTCLGEKSDYPWFMDLATLKAANTVYLVESPINALSIEDCGMPKTAAVAIRGVSNVQNMDFHFCMGKKVVLVMDNDKADEHGKRPGTEAAWLLYEKLTALNIPTHIVNQIPWCESDYNDVNDILKDLDKYKLQTYLKDLEQWAIAGLPGKVDTENEKLREYKGRSRLYLPPHDYAKYWRFGCHEDFSFYTKTVKDKDGENEHDIQQDVCGFRVASVSKLSIASVKSVTTGEPDMMPRVKFAASVQVPRLGHLLRRVFNDEDLHNLDRWRKFGPIFSPAVFSRLLNILERSAVLSERSAINFVGLAWKNGKPAVNEGADCYFTDPDKQCAYDNLIFPSGPTGNARRVIDAYQATFSQNAALILLVWSLGAHIKAFLGFWPHMELQAEKGSGKSVVTERLEGTIGMTMFSGQSINTEYRILTTVSHTFHPIGWEEMSAREQKVIDKAISILQECYNSKVTYRGSDMTEYLQSAPVLLAGEDVPVKSLTGKLVRSELSAHKQGDMMPDNLPTFPVLQWLQFLATKTKPEIKDMHERAAEHCQTSCLATGKDAGAKRMVQNYAAVLVSWRLLCEFSGIAYHQGGFADDLMAEMNDHISQTSSDREPWVWIIERIFSEISSGKYHYPFQFKSFDGEGEPVDCLLIRPNHIMHHISSQTSLREFWNGLPIKTDRVLKKQMAHAGVVHKSRVDAVINKSRECHLVALSLPLLSKFGLHVSAPEYMDTHKEVPGADSAPANDHDKEGEHA